MEPLTPSQRRGLKAQANRLQALVMIGNKGLTDTVVAATDEVLFSHELVKVKFGEHKDEKRELTESLAEQTGSHVVTIIGNVAVLYRQQEDEEKRKIVLERG